MKQPILDDLNEKDAVKKIDRFVLSTALITTIIFFILYFLRSYYPENLIDLEGVKISTNGLLVFIIIIFVSTFVARRIHEIDHERKEFLVGISGGSAIFFADLLYKLMLYYGIISPETGIDLYALTQTSLILSVFGFFISYISVLRLRGKSIGIITLLLIAYCVLIGQLFKYGVI